MPLLIQKALYTDALLRNNAKALFIFGDNLTGRGTGGQAIIRHQENAYGIISKKGVGMSTEDYFTDEDLGFVVQANGARLQHLGRFLRNGGTVYWPKAGIGTGLAQLSVRAPVLLKWLNIGVLEFLKAIDPIPGASS